MIRKCPYCHQEMKLDCYLRDRGTLLNEYLIIEKNEDLTKTKHVIKAAICKKCGYVELYVDVEEEDAK